MRKAILFLLLPVLALLLSGCTSSTPASPEEPARQYIVVGFSQVGA